MSFFSVPNILIATGYDYTDIGKSEIINILGDELTCSNFEDYPNVVEGAVGASLESTPVICGGYIANSLGKLTDKCYAYIDGKWQEFATMTEGRAYAAAIVYEDSLHIFGGQGQSGEDQILLESTEIVHADGTVTVGVDLPGTLAFHAITFVNETVSILTGGNQGSKYLHTT